MAFCDLTFDSQYLSLGNRKKSHWARSGEKGGGIVIVYLVTLSHCELCVQAQCRAKVKILHNVLQQQFS